MKGPFSPEWDAKAKDSRHDEDNKEGSVTSSAKKSGKKGAKGSGGSASDSQRPVGTSGSAKKSSKAD